MTCPLYSSGTSSPSVKGASPCIFRLSAMVVALASPSSMGWTATRVKGHNDIRDSDARLAEVAFGGVHVEPVLDSEDDRNNRPALQADWSARRVWEGSRAGWHCSTTAS